MPATQENRLSLIGLGKLVGFDLSPRQPVVERERLSLEELIRLNAFPVADGYALFPFSDADELDHRDDSEKTVDRIMVYFQTIANIRKEQRDAKISVDSSTKKIGRPSGSIYELGPLSAVWDEEYESRLGYNLSTWDKETENYEYSGFLPLLRLGAIVDQDGIASPLTHDQLSDALAYLVDSAVLSQKKSQEVLDRHGLANRQFKAALEIESSRVRMPKISEHDNRPLWEVSAIIDRYDPDDDQSIRESTRRVLILADQVRAYGDIDKKTGKPGMSVSVRHENGTQVAVVSIPSLGIDQVILCDRYQSEEKHVDGKMITESDLAYALRYLKDSGVITPEQKVLIGGKDESEGLFKPQKLRELTPLKEDQELKFRDMVRKYPFYIGHGEEVGDDGRTNERKKVRLLQHYNLGRYDVYVGEPLAQLNLMLDVFIRREPVFVFHLNLGGLGQNETRTKLALAQAYYAFANTRAAGPTYEDRTVHDLPRNVPSLYRDPSDNLILAMEIRGRTLNARFTQRDTSENRIVPLQIDTQVRTIFKQILQHMVVSTFSRYIRSDIRITPTRVVHPRGDKTVAL